MKNLLLILALFVVGCVSVQDPFAELSLEDVQRNEWKALKGRDLNTFKYRDDFFSLDTINLEKAGNIWDGGLSRSKVYFKVDRENYIVSLKTNYPIRIQQIYGFHEEWLRNPTWATTANLNSKRDFCTALLGTSTKIAPKTKRKMTTDIRYFDYYESNEIDFVCYKPGEREKIVKDNKKQIAEKKLAEKIATCKTYGFKENTDGMGLCLIELDKLAVEAEESYKNLMDLGMNVDSRYSGRIFEVAGNFLRNAIDAKSGKIDKKLKMIELQLKKQKLDQGNKDNTPMEESDGYVISDRNELMKKLLKKD